ncbi:MAG: sodium/hydrogen antiporter [Deltaproteobacteria bacterium]|jgi:NhaP-type Na+/H+ or K+/H+ antiporter/Trk K+ transport system NAD-binding subunit|nr:MAG: sodium/hydrogen antiporter [Deltaproteobacteria bacterium]
MSGADSLLWMTVIAITSGIVAQLISAFMGIPSIVPLFVMGIVIGPEVLGILNPELLGGGFETIIKLCVAIILFEAGLNLDKSEIKKHQKVILPLITYGGLITMFLGAFFARVIMDISWEKAFLFGSLVIVTGPTVIHPLLRRVKVGSRLKNILESEGVFIDPIGAMVAIFVFELIVQESLSFLHSFFLVFFRLAIGTVVGVIGGFLIGKIVKRWSLLMEEIADLFVLASALGIYALSEALIAESGLMAAVASGAILGNMDIPEEDTLRKFKGKLSVLVISLLFILLSANLELKHVSILGWNGVLVVLALLFIVRPIEVFISTIGSDLHFREKVFLSYICPRGIVAASVSSIFAIQLERRGMTWGDEIQGLVFLTIGISVLIQGLTANGVARILGVLIESRRVVIVGANAFGRLVGKLLKKNGREVGLIDTNENLVRIAYVEGFDVVEGNSLDPDNLEKVGITEADTLLAVTTSNKVNLLVSKLVKDDFGIKAAFPVLNMIESNMGKETIAKLGLDIAFGKPLNMYEINHKVAHKEYRVFECYVEDGLAGRKIEDIPVPQDVIAVLLIRGKLKDTLICRSNLSIEKGDKIVFVDLANGLSLTEKLGFKECNQITV